MVAELPQAGQYEYRVGDGTETVEVEDVCPATGFYTRTVLVAGPCEQRKSLLYRIDGGRIWRVGARTTLAGEHSLGEIGGESIPPVLVLDLGWRPGQRVEQSWRLNEDLFPGNWATVVRYAGPTVCADAHGRKHRVVRTSIEERHLDTGSVSVLDTWFSPSLGVPVETVSRTNWTEAGFEYTNDERSTLASMP